MHDVAPTAITVPGSSNTEGAWVELVATTSGRIDAIELTAYNFGTTSTGARRFYLDFATGAAASEVPFVEDLYFGQPSGAATTGILAPTWPVVLPVNINAGQRLSARVQAALTTASPSIAVRLMQSPRWRGPNRWGRASTTGLSATTLGTSITPGGGFINVGSTTPFRTSAIFLGVGSANDNTIENDTYTFTVGVGGSALPGSTHLVETSTAEAVIVRGPLGRLIPCDLPAGTQVQVSCTAVTGTSTLDVTLTFFERR